MFSQFPFHERLPKALESLSFSEPTPVQAAAIPKALEGHDLRVMAQTGSGKIVAFLPPLLHRLLAEGKPRFLACALIPLPTRELAQQTLKEVERFAQSTFIKACLITGGEDFKVQGARLRENPKIIIGIPGRLLEQRNTDNLLLQDVEVLVLDEADRMLDVGFADDALVLTNACPAERRTLLFSATHSGAGLNKVVAEVLREPQALRLDQAGELNENVCQQVIIVDDVAYREQLL